MACWETRGAAWWGQSGGCHDPCWEEPPSAQGGRWSLSAHFVASPERIMWSCLFAQSVSKMNYVNRSLNVSQFCIPGTNLLDCEVLFLNIVGFDILLSFASYVCEGCL